MRRTLIPAIVAIALLTTACASAGRNTRSGALIGTAIGATTGAIVGHQVDRAGSGALIGAGIGALTGAVTGSAIDRAEEKADRALEEARSAPSYPPPSNLSVLEVIRMSQAGLSDGVIIAKIQESGAAFDLTAQDVIDLKRSGVSDAVIEQMLSRPAPRARSRVYAAPSGTRTVYRETTYRYAPPRCHPRVYRRAWWCD